MAEQNQRHRQAMEVREQRHASSIVVVGQLLGFTLGLTGMLGGIFLAIRGKELTGFGSLVVSLATLTGVYLHGRRSAPKS